MPLDPDKLRLITEKAETLSKRIDAFIERRMADSDEDDDDDDDLTEPAEEAKRATPGSDLDNPECEEPWFD